MATLEDVRSLEVVTEDVVTLAQDDAAAALRSVDLDGLRAERPRLEQVVGDVVYGYGYGLSAHAADWYADARLAAGARGRYVPAPVVGLTEAEVSALVGWSLGPLFAAEPDVALAVARLDGGVQKHVANAARLTVTGNVRRDPVRPSYYRGASVNCCAFCSMLTTRVYATQASADFDAHDHDRCFPVPVWPGERFEQPDYYGTFQQDYDDAAAATRRAGEAVTAKNVLPRIRRATGRR